MNFYALILLMKTPCLSTFFSLTGRTLLNTGEALASLSLSQESFTNIGVSTFRASMMSLALVSTSLLIKQARHDSNELSLKSQFMIAIFSSTMASLPSGDIEDISKEIASTTLGMILTAMILYFTPEEIDPINETEEKTNLKLN